MSTLEECDSHIASLAFREGVIPRTKLHRSLVKTPPVDMREVMARADGIIRLEEEELTQSKRTTSTIATPKPAPEQKAETKQYSSRQEFSNGPKQSRPFTRLTVSLAKLFHENKGKGIFRTPPVIHESPEKRDRNKMCAHHNDFGHITDECRSLRYQVEAMLRKGMLSQYRAEPENMASEEGGSKTMTENIANEELLEINTIHGRSNPVEGKEAQSRFGKRQAEKVRCINGIASASESAKALEKIRVISFTQKDMEGIEFSHNDALVVTLRVANSMVKRVMIDGGSSADVLFWSTFKRMKLDEKKIQPNPTPIYAFEGTKAQPIGDVTLPVIAVGKTLFVTFVVVDAPSAYNAIMGRNWIHRMDEEASTRCQVMRCISEDGRTTVDIKGDQVEARRCYSIATNPKPATSQQSEDL
ncbi:uncharacterized protein LOC110747146 [Prunus avium]|uniref:Uncharacterized protein LOC110747146 n=1 Tax=Prunus avium TaxID=42229 RepID=A0A6P5RK10_PRUAV|nr:uncharacterized protein LOC110747146 [Prunus avium]